VTNKVEDHAALERVRKLVFEVKKSPKYGADIMRGFVTRNASNYRNQPLSPDDSRCLINLSSLFYDNLYKEEIKGQPLKSAYFVLAFQNFVSGLTFKVDMAENVILANHTALKVIKVLIEGQTRKIGANNFLRHIYTTKFSKIFIPEYQENIIREILNGINDPKKPASSPYLPIEAVAEPAKALPIQETRSTTEVKKKSARETSLTTASDSDKKPKRNIFKRAFEWSKDIFKGDKASKQPEGAAPATPADEMSFDSSIDEPVESNVLSKTTKYKAKNPLTTQDQGFKSNGSKKQGKEPAVAAPVQ